MQNISSQQIIELKLVNCGLKDKDCLTIARNARFRQLRSLDLSLNTIGEQGLLNLLRAGKQNYLAELEQLILIKCGIGK